MPQTRREGRGKILHIITDLATGGAENALYNLLLGGLNDRFDNSVLSLSDGGQVFRKIQDLGIKVASLGMEAGRLTGRDMIKFLQASRSSMPDLVQGWMYHGNLAASALWLIHRRKPALFWNIRQSLYDIENEKKMTQKVIKASRFVSGPPNAIIYNSTLSRKQHEGFGLKGEQGVVVPNGFDLGRFYPNKDERSRVRKSLGIPADALVVGYIGRHHPLKDIPTLFASIEILLQDDSRACCVLVGRGLESSCSVIPPGLRDIIGSRFLMLGPREDVADLLRGFDVLLLSSKAEAFPNVIGEAMASAVPCVSTDVGDVRQIMGHDDGIVPVGRPAELASAVQRILALTPEERSNMGSRLRERVKTNFALPAVVDRYAELYASAFRG